MAVIMPFAEQPSTAKRTRCRFCIAMSLLDDEQREQAHEAMMNPLITSQTIIDVLREWGVSVSMTVLHRHRTGSAASQPCIDHTAALWTTVNRS